MGEVCKLTTNALTARLYEIRGEERALLVEFLKYLAEIDRRKAAIEMGFSTLFAFCVEYLGLSRASAYRRTHAARLLARFPLVGEYLADGRLNIGAVVELEDVLVEDRLVEILDRAAGRTEEQVKELVASLRPRPAMPDLFRRLPGRRPSTGKDSGCFRAKRLESNHKVAETGVVRTGVAPAPGQVEMLGVSGLAAAADQMMRVGTPGLEAAPEQSEQPMLPMLALASAPRPTQRLEPIAPELHVMRVTVSSEFKDDLEAIRDELSHKFPSRGLEEVLHECIRIALETVRKRRRGAGKATTATPPPEESRYVPAAVRAAVWKRDDGRCTYVGPGGRRCNSRHRVDVHHLDPHGKDGEATVDNLTLRCRPHNLYAAEVDYGRDYVARKIAERAQGGRASECGGRYGSAVRQGEVRVLGGAVGEGEGPDLVGGEVEDLEGRTALEAEAQVAGRRAHGGGDDLPILDLVTQDRHAIHRCRQAVPLAVIEDAHPRTVVLDQPPVGRLELGASGSKARDAVPADLDRRRPGGAGRHRRPGRLSPVQD